MSESAEEKIRRQEVDVDPNNPLPNGSFFEKQAQKKREAFPYPALVTFVYLAMGFLFHMWHPGWIIFMTIPLFYLPAKEREIGRLICNPIMITIVYLLLGFYFHLWHPGWLIFLAIPVFQAAVRK